MFNQPRFNRAIRFAALLMAGMEFPAPAQVVINEVYTELTNGPTLRIIISSNGKTIMLNNFKVLGGSIATIDRLMEQPSCKLPHELWRIRYSALFD